jgi:hypothetical protein
LACDGQLENDGLANYVKARNAIAAPFYLWLRWLSEGEPRPHNKVKDAPIPVICRGLVKELIRFGLFRHRPIDIEETEMGPLTPHTEAFSGRSGGIRAGYYLVRGQRMQRVKRAFVKRLITLSFCIAWLSGKANLPGL